MALVAIIAALIVLGGGSVAVWYFTRDAGPEVVKQDPIEVIESWYQSNPGDYKEAITQYENLIRTTTDSKVKQRAHEAIRKLKTKGRGKTDRVDEANEAFVVLKQKADKLQAEGRYAEAIKVFGDCPPAFKERLATRLAKGVAAVRASRMADAKAGIEKVSILLRKMDDKGGALELDRVSALGVAECAENIAELRDLVKEVVLLKSEDASDRLAQLLDDVDARADLPRRRPEVPISSMPNRWPTRSGASATRSS